VKSHLEIAALLSGRKFTLPLEYQVHTTALIGIRGSGKTVAATDIAEEMCEAGLSWVCIDPVGVWWGLRCNPDGSPGGYPVVIIGGQHADIPLEKDQGAKIADAILEQNACCVIDMSSESKNAVRKFVTDFCDRMMELNPSGTRHIFLEEAPELVPQRPMGEQKRSLAAVDRLGRLGRNKGYGMTLISQRFATINKDILTQCENLIALRCIGKNDRDAAADWIAEVVHETESKKAAEKFVDSLTRLENGQAWFWSPQWMKEFTQIQFRRRKTFHPGETRTVGQAATQVQLSNVREFVERFEKSLRKTSPAISRATTTSSSNLISAPHPDISELSNLRGENAQLRQQLAATKAVISNLQKHLEPEYKAMQALFGELQTISSNGSHANAEVWEPWKQKLGGRMAQMIDALLQRGELTRTQLATLTGQSPNSGSYANNLSKLNSNGLLEKNGDKMRLRAL